ncbi:Otoferlin, partial [Manis pentadactyla]
DLLRPGLGASARRPPSPGRALNPAGSRAPICGFLPTGGPAWVPSSTRNLMDQKEMSVKKKVQNDYD